MCSLTASRDLQCTCNMGPPELRNLSNHMEVQLDYVDSQGCPACCFLQHLPPEAPQMFVTLNPPKPPAANKTIRHLQLAHPVYR